MDIEEIGRIKRDSKLVYELTKMVEELTEKVECQETALRKEDRYYMDEYKKTSDKLHKLRNSILDRGCESCKLLLYEL